MTIYEEEYITKLGKVLTGLEDIKNNLVNTNISDITILQEDIEHILIKLKVYKNIKKYYM